MTCREDTLLEETLYEEELLPVCSPALLAARGRPRTPADLGGWPLLYDLGWDADWSYWFARQGESTPDLSRASGFRLYSMLVQAAVHGIGAAIGRSIRPASSAAASSSPRGNACSVAPSSRPSSRLPEARWRAPASTTRSSSWTSTSIPSRRASGRGEADEVRLHRPGHQHGVGAARLRFAEVELELAHLVPPEGEPRAVVALDPQLDPEGRAELRGRVERRRRVAEADSREPVDDDRPALLVGKRPRLNPVEELPQPGQFVCDKGAVRFCPQTIGVFQKVQYRSQRSDFRGVRQRVRPTARELARRLLRVAAQFAEDVARHVLRRISELHQAVMYRTERRDLCRQRPAPPVDSGSHQRLGERPGVVPRQPRHERFPCGMTKAYAVPEPPGFDFGRHDVSERDFRVSGPMRQSQGIRVHGSSPGVFRAKDCEQERRQPDSSDPETNYSFRGVHGPRLLPGFFTRPGFRLCLFAHNRLSVRNRCVACNDNT